MHRSLLRAADIRNQLQAHLRRLGIKPSSALEGASAFDQEALATVRKALAAGLFINAAKLTDELQVKLSDQDDSGASIYRLVRSAGGEAAAAKLRIHHSSVLFRCRPQWVCFYAAEQNDTGWYEMRDILAIESGWLTELAPHMYRLAPVNTQMRR
jgi:ATP-dependent RNA helicase DDX35